MQIQNFIKIYLERELMKFLASFSYWPPPGLLLAEDLCPLCQSGTQTATNALCSASSECRQQTKKTLR